MLAQAWTDGTDRHKYTLQDTKAQQNDGDRTFYSTVMLGQMNSYLEIIKNIFYMKNTSTFENLKASNL